MFCVIRFIIITMIILKISWVIGEKNNDQKNDSSTWQDLNWTVVDRVTGTLFNNTKKDYCTSPQNS